MRDTIGRVLKGRGVIFVGIFGSRAKGTATENSDIDLVIQFDKDKKYGIFALGGIKMDLEKELGKKVDLVTPSSLSPLLKDEIMKSVESIYDYR